MSIYRNVRSPKALLISLILLLLMSSISFGDGFFVAIPPHPRPIPHWHPYPLEVKYHHVDVNITETSATTSIDQEFYNPTGMRLDGYYIFPIPEGASISKFSMFIDGKEVEAEMLDAKKARSIYEDIVRRNIDPALLEYYQQGAFKIRIFPVEPHSTKKIKISYRQILQADNGTIEYLYLLNTEKFSSKNLRDVSIKVNLSSQVPIKNIYCPTHEVDIVQKHSREAIITYEEHDVKPDRDFILLFKTDHSKIGISLITHNELDETKGFFLLDIAPDVEINPQDIEEKDITFVLDVSGSMVGEKLKQAKKALAFCINNLNNGDRFEIIKFSTEAEALFGVLTPATENNRNKALQFVEKLKAIGGTNMLDALKLVMQEKYSPDRPAVVLFITDGKPTINETNEDRLVEFVKRRKNQSVRIFTFGIGDDINTRLLDKITAVTNAYRTYITPKEDIEVKISNLYTKIQSPVMTNLKIIADNDIRLTEIYPQELPDLFKGASITVLGRYEGSGRKRIAVEGMLKGKKMKFEGEFNFPANEAKNEFIPPLWATRKVGYLLDQIRLHGENKELIDEIVDLSKKYGVITPYTSYLIIEDEEKQIAHNRIRTEELTLRSSVSRDSHKFIEMEQSYSALQEESGPASISASKGVQDLNLKKFVGYNGQYQNQQLNQQIKNVLGRAMYQNGKFWVDPEVQKKKYSKQLQIKFGSEEYFRLLREKPAISQFLALGQNLRFVYDNTLYEITE